MTIVVVGLSITSSWGNGHATTYRALVSALARRGHRVLFLERNVPWYSANRDLPSPPYCRTVLYETVEQLHEWAAIVSAADAVIVGSYVPDGRRVIDWVLECAGGVGAFYDIDTPVTLAAIETGTCDYIRKDQISEFDVYLSFTSGEVLDRLHTKYGARLARPLYCAVDPERYHPMAEAYRWDLGYLGTYSVDRQAALDLRLLEPARRWREGRFVVAGPQFPDALRWPDNVQRIQHLPPAEHPAFYCAQHYTLNVTRAAMVDAGYSPSVRLFEAAACGTAIISDPWPGLENFFEPGIEIFVTHSPDETLGYLRDLPEAARREVSARARRRVLSSHTADHRARELERHLHDARN